MKVAVSRKRENFNIQIGDVVLFKERPCMIIDLGDESDYYGVLALEGTNAGKVIEEFTSLYTFDSDARVTEELIKCEDVVISKGE